MTTVTSLTADRMLAIEAASVVDGDVVGDNLILTKHDGSQINAGSVRGPQGDQGPVGSDLSVLNAIPVLDVGIINQIRAGRQLTAADFTNMGVSAPLGLWNLSDLTDVSGNGRNLLNKGAVPFDVGINGAANTAARFVGSTGQALYISDTGAADPFRIKTGSLGAWSRSARRNASQVLLGKWSGTLNLRDYLLYIDATGVGVLLCSWDGTNYATLTGITDLLDDRWHHLVATFDGITLSLYVDGIKDASVASNIFTLFQGASPFNIGTRAADASTVGEIPHYGRVDEAFITADVLSEDQIRNLYCAKISHTLAAIPSRFSLNVRRRRRGAALVVADFPTQPFRLYNFSAGSLGDEGSNGQAVINGGAVSVAGVDGSAGNAFSFPGSAATLAATDAGLPAALTSRSYGCWFKTYSFASMNAVAWGTVTTGDTRIAFASGIIQAYNAADLMGATVVADGLWHHVVVVEDNAAIDGMKRKLYLDGRLIAISSVMNAVTLAGVNSFRIGSNSSGGSLFAGQIDSVFVCGYALTPEQIEILYIKSLVTLSPSPKNVGDHVEAMSTTNLLAIFDTLEPQHTVDLKAAA